MGPRSQRTSERAAQRQKIRDLEALNKEIVRSSAQARQVYFTNLVFAVVAWLLIGVTNSMLFDWVHVDSVRVGVGAFALLSCIILVTWVYEAAGDSCRRRGDTQLTQEEVEQLTQALDLTPAQRHQLSRAFIR